jgi:PEGA domain-containing protein
MRGCAHSFVPRGGVRYAVVKWPLLSLLLPALAAASPAPTIKRISPLLIAMDQGAEASSLMIETYMNETLETYGNLQLKKTEELFETPPDDAAEMSLRRAEHGYEEGRTSFDAHQYPDAERKLRAALLEYQKAGSAMTECGHLCESLAMYAACAFERGDQGEARQYLIDLNALDKTLELSPKRFRKELLALRATVGKSRQSELRGNIHVKTKPAGARVYLDGDFQGYTPHTLSTLPVGKHLVRVERPGFRPYGELVELAPEQELEVETELSPSQSYRSYDALLDKVAAEVARDRPGPALAALGKSLGLDRALVGVVKEIDEQHTTELLLGLYDLHTGKKLSFRKLTFQGDEFGQLKSEVHRVVTGLITASGAEKQGRSSDPLENRSGMEDWGTEEQSTQQQKTKPKKGGKDPLDSVSGTEEW